MKEFRKTKLGLFICEECGKTFKNKNGLTTHIQFKHNGEYFNYYEKYLKSNDDGYCKICGNKTFFRSLSYGYNNTCSEECSKKYTYEQTKKGNLKKYGVENPFQRKDIISSLKRKFINKSEKEKQQIIQRRKSTYIKRYGVEWSHQNKNILHKALKNSKKVKQFKDTNLWYQGSYELDFLEKYYNELDIERGPIFHYKFNKQNKIYHSDFYIPSKNLIVEIKSSFYENRHKEKNKLKEEIVLSKGFNFIKILDKDYSLFNKL